MSETPNQYQDENHDDQPSKSRKKKRFFFRKTMDQFMFRPNDSLPRWQAVLIFSTVCIIAAAIGVVCILFLPESPSQRFFHKQGPYHNPAPEFVGFSEVVSFKVNIKKPVAMAVDNQGDIFVAGNGKISRYTRFGLFNEYISIQDSLSAMSSPASGMLFADHLILVYPKHIDVIDTSGNTITSLISFPEDAWLVDAVTNQNHLFVSDCVHKAVYCFDKDGTLVRTIAKDTVLSRDNESFSGFFVSSPYFPVDCDSSGTLWAANPMKHQLFAFTPEGVWDSIRSWGKGGNNDNASFTGCCNPADFTILKDKRFVTVEKQVQQVKVFSPEGMFLSFVAFPSSFDPAPHLFEAANQTDTTGSLTETKPENEEPIWKPSLKVDSLPDDQIVILDPDNRTVFVFTEGAN